jgi:hypothetical protein
LMMSSTTIYQCEYGNLFTVVWKFPNLQKRAL